MSKKSPENQGPEKKPGKKLLAVKKAADLTGDVITGTIGGALKVIGTVLLILLVLALILLALLLLILALVVLTVLAHGGAPPFAPLSTEDSFAAAAGFYAAEWGGRKIK